MRKRLQKKLRVGPFEDYGFEVVGVLKKDADPEVFLDDLINYADEQQFYFGGGFDPDLKIDLYIDCGIRSDNPVEKYDKAMDWLKKYPAIESYEKTQLSDINGRAFVK